MASLTGTKIKDTYDSLLKVSDNGALDGTLQTITDGLGNNSALSLSTAGASVGGTLAVSGNAAFDTNTLFVDAANNRVGVGTNTPDKPLVLRASAPEFKIISTTPQAGVASAVISGSNSGSLFIYADSGDFATSSAYMSLGVSDVEAMQIKAGGDVSFRDSSANEAFYWDASAGSLGIGTTSPNTKLQIQDGSLLIETLASSNKPQIILGSTGANYGQIQNDSSGIWSLGYGAGYSSLGTSVLTWNSSGNVGIGTASPSDKLSVYTTTDYGNNSTYANATIGLGNQTYPVSIRSYRYGGSYLNGLDFYYNNGTPQLGMRIDSSGNVGIGESNPTSISSGATTLQIKGTSTTKGGAIFLKSFDSSVSSYFYADATNGLTIATATNHPMRFTTNGSERMRIDSSGNVILANSDSRLRGGDTTGRLVVSNSDTTAYVALNGSSNADPNSVSLITNQIIKFQTGASFTERMRINSSGNVGIGTTNPLSILHVSAPKPTYTDTGVVFRGGTTNNNSFSGISLMSTGDALAGQIGSNYLVDGVTVSQTSSSRSSAYIQFSNTTSAGQTSSISFGGLVKGTTTKVERMQITSAGDVLFGSGGAEPSASQIGLKIGVGASGTFINNAKNVTTSTSHFNFYNPNGIVGTITTSGSATAYNTSSDYRLKEDWVAMEGALDRVDLLKPINFAWKADGSRVDGFLAHELQEVVPEAVTGEKDATEIRSVEVSPAVYEDVIHPAEEAILDEEGNVIEEAKEEWVEKVLVSEAVYEEQEVPVYQGIDQSKIVPLLAAGLQEAHALIKELRAELNALKQA